MGRKKQPGDKDIDEDWVKKEVKLILDVFKPTLHWWMPSATIYGRTGSHDFIITQRACSWTIETKAGKNEPTENQIAFATSQAEAGGLSLLINEFNLHEVIRVAVYVDVYGRLPYFLAHDFNKYSK